MAGDTIITVVGNTTAAPEGRFFPTGAFVANFTVASTPRTFNKQRGEWEDGETLYMRCNAWGKFGEQIVDSIESGARVVVQGRLKQRTFQNKEGEKRTVVELEVDELGPSLRYATAKVTKVKKNNQRKQAPAETTAPTAEVGDDDPWGAAPEPQLVGAGASSASGEGNPPF
ncbi:single-stranded DNA-binding protein [Amycolatopsis anabasis]|uniref:single-stranded DNA-binding protein n=1 Tax=Amycolatopsis anabasis TaxID=1840409 RepID=UPI00131A8E43|nr:single-stranded DNA-binding protein [Amycolatopsis anabasis]